MFFNAVDFNSASWIKELVPIISKTLTDLQTRQLPEPTLNSVDMANMLALVASSQLLEIKIILCHFILVTKSLVSYLLLVY